MALRFCSGFDFDVGTASTRIDAVGGGTTRDTTIKRTGSASVKLQSGTGNSWSLPIGISPVHLLGQTWYYRFYVYLSSDFTMAAGDHFFWAGYALVTWTTGRGLEVFRRENNASVSIGSSTSTIPLETWTRIELMVRRSSALDAADAEIILRINGTTEVSANNVVHEDSTSFFLVSQNRASTVGAIYVDDLQINDSTGSANNSWPGEGYVLSALPVADSQRGSWTGGAGGTTDLWEALNNLPPAGTAAETNTTQIESADSSGDNATDEYRAQFDSYDTIGVASADTVAGLMLCLSHGEDVSTGTKTGSVGFQSNPSASYWTFTFGNDAGALGTFPVTWASHGSIRVLDNPTVTRNQNIITGLRKTDTGTRVASVCFMGIYVAVAVTAAATKAPAPPGRFRRLVHNLAR